MSATEREIVIANFAAAFIECTCEWDYDQLPDQVQSKLTQAATAFVDFAYPSMSFRNELPAGTP